MAEHISPVQINRSRSSMSHIMSTQDLQCTNGAKHRSACGRVSRIKILIAATSLKPTDSPITDSVNKYSLLSTLDLMDF